jgi:hypothetical protein
MKREITSSPGWPHQLAASPLLERGLADREEIDQRIANLDEWKSHPGAIAALA